jgi:hypothetical protein
MSFETVPANLNEDQANLSQLNEFPFKPCQGVTLASLRQRLRNELSGYGEDTLISMDPANDVEKQFINDGISQLYPHDWQAVMYAVKQNEQGKVRRFYVPDDCEQVLAVFSANQDINNNTVHLDPLPHGEFWRYDDSFIDALSPTLLGSGEPWVDQTKKGIWLQPFHYQVPWIVVRYARKWPAVNDDQDCLDPTPNRVQAIIFYACAQYFISQLQVNTESIRYRNYQALATNFLQLFQQQLTRNSKPLYYL